MMLNIKTGEYQVFDSGVVHVMEEGKTIISLGETNIELIFETKTGEEQSVDFKAVDKKNAQIRFTNVQGSLGFGTTRPFQIGESDGRALFLTFVTRSLNDTYLRTFEYTLYIK